MSPAGVPNQGTSGDQPLRLCHVIDSLGRGGTQRCLIHLVEGLSLRGYQQHIVCLNDDVDAEILASLRRNARIVVIGRWSLLLGWGMVRLFQLLRRERIQVVQTYLWHADVIGRSVAWAARVPTIFSSVRARNVDKRAWQFWLDRLTVRWAQRVIYNSRQVVAFSREHEGVTPDQVLVIPNGVEQSPVSGPSREILLQQVKLPVDARFILSVGRLYPQKGHDVLIQAFAQLAGHHPHLFLLIAGEGPERPKLEQLISGHGLTSRVLLLGSRQDVTAWLAAADTFILASRFEGMPNALMEAMAAGLPVITSRTDGSTELIRNEETGLLVPPEDPAALAAAIRRLLSEPDFARCLGKAGQDLMATKFSLQSMVDSYDAAYRASSFAAPNPQRGS